MFLVDDGSENFWESERFWQFLCFHYFGRLTIKPDQVELNWIELNWNGIELNWINCFSWKAQVHVELHVTLSKTDSARGVVFLVAYFGCKRLRIRKKFRILTSLPQMILSAPTFQTLECAGFITHPFILLEIQHLLCDTSSFWWVSFARFMHLNFTLKVFDFQRMECLRCTHWGPFIISAGFELNHINWIELNCIESVVFLWRHRYTWKNMWRCQVQIVLGVLSFRSLILGANNRRWCQHHLHLVLLHHEPFFHQHPLWQSVRQATPTGVRSARQRGLRL